MSTAIGYLRVSTEDQAKEGVSLDAQAERIRAFCLLNNHHLDAMYRDEGLSGKKADNRPGLVNALDHVCREQGILVVYSLSRMSRSVRDTIDIAERLTTAGANLSSLTEAFDTSTATGRMVFKLLAVFAEFEREILGERTSAALQHKARNGERVGRYAKFGYQLVAGVQEPCPQEQGTIHVMQSFKLQGISCKDIAAFLNSGMVYFRGRPWRTEQVQKILKGIKNANV